jgi:hypothetical protein
MICSILAALTASVEGVKHWGRTPFSDIYMDNSLMPRHQAQSLHDDVTAMALLKIKDEASSGSGNPSDHAAEFDDSQCNQANEEFWEKGAEDETLDAASLEACCDCDFSCEYGGDTDTRRRDSDADAGDRRRSQRTVACDAFESVAGAVHPEPTPVPTPYPTAEFVALKIEGHDCPGEKTSDGGGLKQTFACAKEGYNKKVSPTGMAMVGMQCGDATNGGCEILAPRFFGDTIGGKKVDGCQMLTEGTSTTACNHNDRDVAVNSGRVVDGRVLENNGRI